MRLRNDCNTIVREAIAQVRPDAAVARALAGKEFGAGKLILVAVGKAAWSMAHAAWESLDRKPDGGIVITKHGHSEGPIGNLEVWEAGHPVPDDDTFAGHQPGPGADPGSQAGGPCSVPAVRRRLCPV